MARVAYRPHWCPCVLRLAGPWEMSQIGDFRQTLGGIGRYGPKKVSI